MANGILNRFSLHQSSPEAAVALENLVFTPLKGWCSYGPLGRKLYYWRSVSKEEVDFIVARDGIVELAIEVKSMMHPKPEHFKGLRAFGEEIPLCQKILVCFTEHPFRTEDGIRIEPVGGFLHDGWREFCRGS